jgi:plasmid stability protein
MEEKMATLTIRNLRDEVVKRLKEAAKRKGKPMEQEVRELLESRYKSR